MKIRHITFTAVVLLTAGCGASNNSGQNAAQNAPPPVTHTVFAPYIQDLNKAKNVQTTLQAEKQKTDQQLQQAEAGTTSTQPSSAQPPDP